MGEALFQPLNARWKMQRRSEDGREMREIAATFIKPNDRLSSFERLEIYNRQYWFRLLDCLYDDYPGVRAVLGERWFMKLTRNYLTRHPSRSYSLRDLGNRLEQFLHEIRTEPEWADTRPELLQIARDMARFEWAQVVAFDGPSATVITPDDVLGKTPADLRLGLQPYLSLLELRYAVDEFSVAIKKEQALRGEASQAMDSAPERKAPAKRTLLPRRENIWLAVHRVDNVIYFKRLEREAFAILRALGEGFTLEQACEQALPVNCRTDADLSAKIGEWFSNWAQLGWLTV